jgi:hypothetical protein
MVCWNRPIFFFFFVGTKFRVRGGIKAICLEQKILDGLRWISFALSKIALLDPSLSRTCIDFKTSQDALFHFVTKDPV